MEDERTVYDAAKIKLTTPPALRVTDREYIELVSEVCESDLWYTYKTYQNLARCDQWLGVQLMGGNVYRRPDTQGIGYY